MDNDFGVEALVKLNVYDAHDEPSDTRELRLGLLLVCLEGQCPRWDP